MSLDISLIEATLQTATFFSGAAIGEAWQIEDGATPELISFFSSSPLVVRIPDERGVLTEQNVSVSLAKSFSSSHQQSLKLIQQVTASQSWYTSSDISGDDLLKRLSFKLSSAVAVPSKIPGIQRVQVVFILYLESGIDVSIPLLGT